MTHRDGSRLLSVAVCCDGPDSRKNETDRQRRNAFAMISWLVAFALVVVMSSTVMGQNYEELPFNKSVEAPAVMKRMTNAAKAYSQARDLSTVKDQSGARYYYGTYVPAKITQMSAVGDISSLLKEAQTRMTSSQRSGNPGARQIMGLLYNGLKPVALGNYHPPARIAAISFISRMDVAPANLTQKKPPTPLPYIPKDFIPVYLDNTAPDGVRAAALQAVHRYVMYAAPSLQNPLRGQLSTAMKDLLSSAPPEGRKEDVHAYLQRFAVDILANLRTAADPELGKTLVSISTKNENHDLIALHSAARIGSMAADLRGSVGSTQDVLNSWSVRAMRAFQYEIARLNALTRPKAVSSQPRPADSIAQTKSDDAKPAAGASSMMGREDEMGEADMMGYGEGDDMMMEGQDDLDMDMMGAGMMGGYGAMGVVEAAPQPSEVMTSRRKLNHVLQQLHMGVTGSGTVGLPKTEGGLLAAADAGEKPAVNEWLEGMEAVVTALNDPQLSTREKYVEALDEQVAALESIAGPAAVASVADLAIKLPGVVGPVSITAVPKEEAGPDGPTLDASGAPTFPAVDELAAPE